MLVVRKFPQPPYYLSCDVSLVLKEGSRNVSGTFCAIWENVLYKNIKMQNLFFSSYKKELKKKLMEIASGYHKNVAETNATPHSTKRSGNVPGTFCQNQRNVTT